MVVRITRAAGDAEVLAVIEPGAQATTRMLHEAGFVVHVVDGKQLKHFRESLTSGGSSNDELCAYWAWRMAQSSAHLKTPYQPLSDEDQAFATTLRVLEWLSKDATRAINQLRAVLEEQVPDIEGSLSSLKSAYARDLIRLAPTSWHAAELTEGQWEEFLSTRRVPKKKRATLWAAIQAAASRHTLADLDAAEPLADVIAQLVGRLDDLLRRERKLEARLAALAVEDEAATVASSIPGIGARTSARLSVDVFSAEHLQRAEHSPDPRDYATRRTLCAPIQNQTGTTRNAVRRRHGGSRAASVATLRAAAQAKMRIPWAKAMYEYGRSRGDGHYSVLRKIGRSLMRILTSMVRNGTEYDDALYVQRLQGKGVVWAMGL
jgi:transposase